MMDSKILDDGLKKRKIGGIWITVMLCDKINHNGFNYLIDPLVHYSVMSYWKKERAAYGKEN